MVMKLELRTNQNAPEEEQLANELCDMESCFEKILNADQFTGIKIICGSFEISTDRNVMALRVPFFNDALLHDTVGENTIEIPPEISSDAVELVIQYAHFKQPKVNLENAQALLEAAAFFRIEDLWRLCDQFIAKRIVLTVPNCLEVCSYAIGNSAELLKKAAEAFIAEHISGVSDTDAFKRMSGSEITSFLILYSNERNIIPNENTDRFWRALVKWIMSDIKNRKSFMPELLKLTRLPSLSADYVIRKVLPHPLIDGSPACRQMIQDLLLHTQVLQHKQMLSHVYFFNWSYGIQVLYIPDRKWVRKECREMNLKKFTKVVAVRDSCIYCVSDSKQLISYIPATDKWAIISGDQGRPKDLNLNFLRMCSVDGKLTACGFDKDNSELLFCCSYDESSNRWDTNILNMNADAKCVLLGFCGMANIETGSPMLCANISIRGDRVSNLYLFDLQSGRLIRITGDLSSPFSDNAIVSRGEKVFVLDYDQETVSTFVKVYDVALDEWTSLPPLNVVNFQLVVANDCLYAIGGYNRALKNNLSVKYVDLTDISLRWKHGPDLLSEGFRSFGFGHAVFC